MNTAAEAASSVHAGLGRRGDLRVNLLTVISPHVLGMPGYGQGWPERAAGWLACYAQRRSAGRIGLADQLSVDSRTMVEAGVMPRRARRSPEPAPVRATRAAARVAAPQGPAGTPWPARSHTAVAAWVSVTATAASMPDRRHGQAPWDGVAQFRPAMMVAAVATEVSSSRSRLCSRQAAPSGSTVISAGGWAISGRRKWVTAAWASDPAPTGIVTRPAGAAPDASSCASISVNMVVSPATRVEAGATVSLHAGDADLASGRAHRKNQRPLAAYLWRPAALAATWELAAGGGRHMPAIGSHNQVEDGQRLDLPGRPVVVGLPGHTLGSVGYTLPDRGVCFSGDALVTWNLLTGRRGPQLLAAGFIEDTTKALASLDRLAELDASILLPGHGEPWTGPMSQAVTQARNAGIS